MGRILAIDPGAKWIGLAVTDPGQKLAQPLETRSFASLTKLADYVRLYCGREGVELVVIGLPVGPDGYEGESCMRSRALAGMLAARGISCVLWDESWSSRDARKALTGMGVKPGKGKLDAVAASLILRDFLDNGGKGAISPGSSLPGDP